jgi:hypothetical protein
MESGTSLLSQMIFNISLYLISLDHNFVGWHAVMSITRIKVEIVTFFKHINTKPSFS